MISAWHLVWVVPVSTAFGFFVASWFSVNKGEDEYE